MKIVVFGATGKTGIEVIKQSLDKGYEVVAYARSPNKIEIQNERLSFVKGELNDAELIESTISNADAVVSLLGASGNVKDNALSQGVKNIISAMEKNGVSRVIQVLTSAAKDPNDKHDAYFDLMIGLVKIGIPRVYSEILEINDSLRNSGLNWTIVRAPFLTDKPLTKNLRIGYKGEKIVKKNLSRADLAWFMVDAVESEEYVRKAPFISN